MLIGLSSAVSSLSLRTSAHTGVAIRSPLALPSNRCLSNCCSSARHRRAGACSRRLCSAGAEKISHNIARIRLKTVQICDSPPPAGASPRPTVVIGSASNSSANFCLTGHFPNPCGGCAIIFVAFCRTWDMPLFCLPDVLSRSFFRILPASPMLLLAICRN